MKRFLTALLVLTAPLASKAQGTVYVSGLGSPQGSVAIDGTTSFAQIIMTGNNPGGYILNSIQVQMLAAVGNPTGFTLSLYAAVNGVRTQDLGDLSGSASPTTAGVYTYDASALDLTLSPSTFYYAVETASNPSSQGSYEWGLSENITDEGGWNYRARSTAAEMAITATAVPEPSTWALLIMGASSLRLLRRHKA